MVRKKDKRKLIVLLSVLGVLLIAIITVAIIKVANSDSSKRVNESNQTSSTSDTTQQSDTASDSDRTEQRDTQVASPDSEEAPVVDPATVATIDIKPMGITVSYVKGAGGFEYEVLRTPNGSQYVEFRSPDLIGTKCTDDQGAFVSILENPSSSEGSTIAKSVTVGDAQYGLSLAAANCTSDAEKLQKYQQSFNDAFNLLKKQE